MKVKVKVTQTTGSFSELSASRRREPRLSRTSVSAVLVTTLTETCVSDGVVAKTPCWENVKRPCAPPTTLPSTGTRS